MSRSQRKSIAEETVQILEARRYVAPSAGIVPLGEAMERMLAATELFTPAALAALDAPRPVPSGGAGDRATAFSVRNETTLSAARRLTASGRVLCLNFASAKNPGGGFLGGSQAQEESLARASTLYASLLAAPAYYEANRACGTALYTDHMILSPFVTVFRDDADELLEEPYEVAFLTAPAPNAGALRQHRKFDAGRVEETLRRRIGAVLAIAAARGYPHLVLGAWGCGVFRNDPSRVAGLFAEQLHGDFRGVFEQVAFAVLDRGNEIIRPFERAFG